jgi:hypothetical protein
MGRCTRRCLEAVETLYVWHTEGARLTALMLEIFADISYFVPLLWLFHAAYTDG